MRLLFGWLAAFLGAVSIALAARYGYKGADTIIDGVISSVVFGAIALCAFIFDAAAVRLWFMRHHAGAIVIGVIAAAALVVTFTNSLGAIAARGDTTQAERRKAKTDSAADQVDLKRIARERDAMVFTPVTAEVVKAAQEAVRSAEEIRQRECGAGDPRQRGPNCRQRETEEQAKRDGLTATLANKALTDRAAKLDQDAETVRAKLGKAPLVEKPNPLGETLELLLGAAAAALTAWQQAVVAAVFELCLVGVMVIYELLGQDAGGRVTTQDKANPEDRQADRDPIPASAVAKPFPSPPERSRTKAGAGLASVKTFIGERVYPVDGERIEMKALVHEYRAWCGNKGVEPVALESFLEVVEKVCRKIGIEIVNDAQRVFCLNVRIDAAESANASLH
jgi:hypothetical protein